MPAIHCFAFISLGIIHALVQPHPVIPSYTYHEQKKEENKHPDIYRFPPNATAATHRPAKPPIGKTWYGHQSDRIRTRGPRQPKMSLNQPPKTIGMFRADSPTKPANKQQKQRQSMLHFPPPISFSPYDGSPKRPVAVVEIMCEVYTGIIRMQTWGFKSPTKTTAPMREPGAPGSTANTPYYAPKMGSPHYS